MVLKYELLNLRSFGDRLVRVSILVRKRLDFRPVLEVHFGRKGFGYLDIRERPINLYSALSSYWNTNYGNFEMLWFGFQSWYIKG